MVKNNGRHLALAVSRWCGNLAKRQENSPAKGPPPALYLKRPLSRRTISLNENERKTKNKTTFRIDFESQMTIMAIVLVFSCISYQWNNGKNGKNGEKNKENMIND